VAEYFANYKKNSAGIPSFGDSLFKGDFCIFRDIFEFFKEKKCRGNFNFYFMGDFNIPFRGYM
jgi:hypothetical protein